MPKLPAFLLCAFLLPSCSTIPKSAAGDDAQYFASLSQEQAEAELNKVLSDINKLDGEIRSAEARLDTARMQQASDASKRDAVDNAEAALDGFRARKGGLINRQVQLERRLRQFESNNY